MKLNTQSKDPTFETMRETFFLNPSLTVHPNFLVLTSATIAEKCVVQVHVALMKNTYSSNLTRKIFFKFTLTYVLASFQIKEKLVIKK